MMKKKKSAFTLIEMIIVVAVTVILLAITSAIFITGIRIFSDSNVKSTLQMDAQIIHEQLTNICMQGSSIEEVTLENSTKYKGEEIKNNITDFKATKEIVINLCNDDMTKKQYTFTFSKEDNKLVMKDNSGAVKSLSTNVTAFMIMPNGDNGVQFQVDLDWKKRPLPKSYSVDVDATFRNKNAIKITSS